MYFTLLAIAILSLGFRDSYAATISCSDGYNALTQAYHYFNYTEDPTNPAVTCLSSTLSARCLDTGGNPNQNVTFTPASNAANCTIIELSTWWKNNTILHYRRADGYQASCNQSSGTAAPEPGMSAPENVTTCQDMPSV